MRGAREKWEDSQAGMGRGRRGAQYSGAEARRGRKGGDKVLVTRGGGRGGGGCVVVRDCGHAAQEVCWDR